jgi:lauroyl/myristoyl acyltransferase
VLPVFVVFDRGTRFRLVTLPPLRFERDAGLPPAMRQLVRAMESIASRYPDQWFNFYDVWDADGNGSS